MTEMHFQIRRVVTGHNSVGKAVFVEDEILTAEPTVIPFAAGDQRLAGSLLWATAGLPVDNSEETREAESAVTRNVLHEKAPRGDRTLFRVTDLPPGSVAPMHRTQTIDYGILLEGECDLVLDSGASTTFRAGDVVIQRGTSHTWVNRSEQVCRWAWILIDAQVVRSGDEVLGPEWNAAPGHLLDAT